MTSMWNVVDDAGTILDTIEAEDRTAAEWAATAVEGAHDAIGVHVRPVVEIPADVRDNSETVTDYAFRRDLSPDKGVRTPAQRDRELKDAREHTFGMYDVYTWRDVNQGNRQGWGAGQRCRFDMVVNRDSGGVIALFHTEYFTRVACVTHEHYYATHYASVTDQGGVTTVAQPYCDECMRHLRRSAAESGMAVNESERLLIGQHD